MKRFTFILAAVLTLSVTAHAFTTDTLSVDATGYLPQNMTVAVITPDGPRPQSGFPSVYLLNGFGGDHKSWGIIRPDLGTLADNMGLVLVMPSGMDTWYWDAPADSTVRMESFITEVLVPYVDTNYPTDRRAENRAVTGLSMGGHGGLWLGLRHPDIWKSCGSTSGGVNIMPFPKNWKMSQWLGPQEENADTWKTHTVRNMVDRLVPGTSNIIFDCGSEDFFAEVNADLHTALLEAGIPHDYISRPGKHNSAYWANALPYQLMYFKSKFIE